MLFHKSAVIFAIFLSCCGHLIFCQDFIGHASGNYAGVVGAALQPASLAGNIYKFDLYLAGGSLFATNNYYAFYRSRPFLNFSFHAANDTLVRSNEVRHAFITSRVQLPSAMLTLKNGDGVGFSASIRTAALADKLSPELANDLAGGFDTELSEGIPRTGQLLKASGISWQEYGITYARIIVDEPHRVIKAGITLKMMIGNAGFYADTDIAYTSLTAGAISIENFQLDYGYSDNFDHLDEDWVWKAASNPAPGLDVGIEYLRKEQVKNVCPTFDGSVTHYHKEDLIGYRYKVGVALLDVGRIKFNYGEGSGTITGVRSLGNVDLLEKLSIGSPDELIDSISTFATVERNTGEFTAGLPTRLRVNFDYHVKKNFYVETAALLDLGFLKFNDYAPGNISYLTVIPRWEKDWIGVCLPVYANARGQLNCGAGIRIGPLVLGTYDILPLVNKKKMKSQGFYIALKTFMIKRKHKMVECEGIFH